MVVLNIRIQLTLQSFRGFMIFERTIRQTILENRKSFWLRTNRVCTVNCEDYNGISTHIHPNTDYAVLLLFRNRQPLHLMLISKHSANALQDVIVQNRVIEMTLDDVSFHQTVKVLWQQIGILKVKANYLYNRLVTLQEIPAKSPRDTVIMPRMK